MEIIPEPEWEGLFDEIVKNRGAAIIIGSTDSGKSYLARYLIKRLILKNMNVCLIDSDIGQSSLGLPGTISMKVFSTAEDVEDFTFEKMYFTGTVNPSKRISLIIEVARRMSDVCREHADVTLIDTSGLISGEIGKALKIGKIKAVKPEHVIAVQRHDELEHILEMVENLKFHRIRASKYAKIRNMATRIRYRKKKFEDYFNNAESANFFHYSTKAKFLYNNKPVSPKEGMFRHGTLIGLNHDEDTIALGILDEVTDNSITFRSPIYSLKNINKVIFGDIKI